MRLPSVWLRSFCAGCVCSLFAPGANAFIVKRSTGRSIRVYGTLPPSKSIWRSNNTTHPVEGKAKEQWSKARNNRKFRLTHRKRNKPKNGKTSKENRFGSSKKVITFNKKMSSILRSGKNSLESTQTVDGILWKRVEPYLRTPDGYEPPPNPSRATLSFDVVSFNIVMLAWSRQGSWESAAKANEWLQRLWQMAPRLQADSYSYGAVLTAYAKARSVKAATAAQSLFQQHVSTSRLTTDSLHNAVMDAWARSGHPQAGERAHTLLRQLQALPNVQPTQISFNTCIKAFSNTPGRAEQAQELLEEMKASETISPNSLSYTTCIVAWTKEIKVARNSRAPGRSERCAKAAAAVRRLLTEMEDTYNRTRDERVRPDLYTYTAVLSSQALPPLEVWARMNEFSGGRQPNAAFLNTCIHLIGQALEKKQNSGDMGKSFEAAAATSAKVAEALLRQMQHQQETFNTGENKQNLVENGVCKVTYTAVIAVWAQCGTAEAALRAEQLLDELQQMWEATQNPDYLPSAKTYCSVLTAWSKVASNSLSSNETVLDHALGLQQRMHSLFEQTKSPELAPNTIIFMQLFKVLARARDPSAAARAKELLELMEKYAKQGHTQVRPDSTVLASFLNTLTKSRVENIVELATHILEQVEEGYDRGMGHLKPNSLLYSAVLQAYAKSASKHGATMSENLLRRTEQLYRDGKVYAKPTAMFYNAVMDALARSNGGREAAERAESFLFGLLQKSTAGDPLLTPTARSYNAAILAWKNSRASDAPQRAELLLKHMNERCSTGSHECCPDLVTYNSIIATWANSDQADAPNRARDLLIFMEEQARNGELGLAPDRITFNSCINAFSGRGAATEATEVFVRMLKCHFLGFPDVEPDQVTLACLRSVWKKSGADDAESQLKRIECLMNELKGKQCKATIRKQ